MKVLRKLEKSGMIFQLFVMSESEKKVGGKKDILA